jgi:hypothetical protein
MPKPEFADEVPEAASNEYMQGDQFDPDAEMSFAQKELMPEGFYPAKLIEIKNDGGPNFPSWKIVYFFVCCDEGEWRNQSLPVFITLRKDNKPVNMAWVNDNVLKALNANQVEVNGKMEWKFKPSSLIDRAVILQVEHSTYQGETRERVKKVLPPDERAEELAENFVI